jgi:hypothetical protein
LHSLFEVIKRVWPGDLLATLGSPKFQFVLRSAALIAASVVLAYFHNLELAVTLILGAVVSLNAELPSLHLLIQAASWSPSDRGGTKETGTGTGDISAPTNNASLNPTASGPSGRAACRLRGIAARSGCRGSQPPELVSFSPCGPLRSVILHSVPPQWGESAKPVHRTRLRGVGPGRTRWP